MRSVAFTNVYVTKLHAYYATAKLTKLDTTALCNDWITASTSETFAILIVLLPTHYSIAGTGVEGAIMLRYHDGHSSYVISR